MARKFRCPECGFEGPMAVHHWGTSEVECDKCRHDFVPSREIEGCRSAHGRACPCSMCEQKKEKERKEAESWRRYVEEIMKQYDSSRLAEVNKKKTNEPPSQGIGFDFNGKPAIISTDVWVKDGYASNWPILGGKHIGHVSMDGTNTVSDVWGTTLGHINNFGGGSIFVPIKY